MAGPEIVEGDGPIYPGHFAPPRPGRSAKHKTRRMVEQMAAEVGQLDAETMRAVLPVLQEARRELRDGLRRWISQVEGGNERFTAQAMRNALVQLEGAIEQIRKLEPTLRDALEAGVDASGLLAVEHLHFELARMSGVFGQSLRPIPIDTAAVIARGRKMLIPRMRTSAARYAGRVGDDIRTQLAVGVARHETFHQMAVRLRANGGPRGLVALRGVKGVDLNAIVEDIPEGLFRRYRHWAERVVRTETINAYNTQHLDAIKELNEEGVGREKGDRLFGARWDSSMDSRLCVICRDLDRRFAKPGEEFAAGVTHPPAHPNCRCVITAWNPEWGDIKDETTPLKEGAKAKAPPTPKKQKAPPKEKLPKGASRVDKLEAANARRLELERKVRDPHGKEALLAEKEALGKRSYGKRGPERAAMDERMFALNDKLDKIAELEAKGIGPDPALAKELHEATDKADRLRQAMSPQERADYAARLAAKASGEPTTYGQYDENWGAVRHELDASLEARGLARSPGDRNLTVRIEDLHGEANAYHEWDGRIRVDAKVAEVAKNFAATFAKDPAATRKAMADGARLLRPVQDIEEKRRKLVDRKEAVRLKLPIDLRTKLWDVRSGDPLPTEFKGENRKIATQYRKLEAQNQAMLVKRRDLEMKAKDHPGVRLLAQSDRMRTMVHEAAHGWGNKLAPAYQGPGQATEEITTEVVARSEMARSWGVPRSTLTRKGSYGHYIDPLTDRVAELYGVPPEKAFQIIEDASMAFKSRKGDAVLDGTTLMEQFVDSFPETGNRDLDRHRPALIGTGGRQRGNLQWELERLISEMPTVY